MVSERTSSGQPRAEGGDPNSPRIAVRLTDHPIALEPLWQEVADDDAGAHFIFVGRTRRTTAGKLTQQLSYEAFRPMAESELRNLLFAASKTYQLTAAVIVHRLGEVAVGEASIAVAVSSPHRRNGFDAVAWIMDQVKQHVPIWKRERFEDGTTEWVHPTRNQDD